MTDTDNNRVGMKHTVKLNVQIHSNTAGAVDGGCWLAWQSD